MSRLNADGHSVSVHPPQAHGEHLLKAYWRFLRHCQGEIVHFHLHSLLDKHFMGFFGAIRKPIILTVHGQNLEDQARALSPSRKKLLGLAMRRLSAVIGVSDRIRIFAIEELGVDPNKAYTIPAFLPPDQESLQKETPQPDIVSFLEEHQPVICANAFNLSLYEGVPLYGSDMLVDLLSHIRGSHPNAGVLFFVSIVPKAHEVQLDALRQQIEQKGLDAHFKIVLGSHPFGPTLVRSDLLVRPTATDGDAVSIREGLSLGIPVVASDVVPRPEGTKIFSHRNMNELVSRARETLAANQEGTPSSAIAQQDVYPEILKVYENVCS